MANCPICKSLLVPTGTPEDPIWVEDPICTRGGLAGVEYVGQTPIRVAHLVQLQIYYTYIATQLGVTLDTWVSIGSGQIKAIHVVQIRIAVEQILTALGRTLVDYFSGDKYGNIYTSTQIEWTDCARTNGIPYIPKGAPIRAIHIEELRRGTIIISGWLEHFLHLNDNYAWGDYGRVQFIYNDPRGSLEATQIVYPGLGIYTQSSEDTSPPCLKGDYSISQLQGDISGREWDLAIEYAVTLGAYDFIGNPLDMLVYIQVELTSTSLGTHMYGQINTSKEQNVAKDQIIPAYTVTEVVWSDFLGTWTPVTPINSFEAVAEYKKLNTWRWQGALPYFKSISNLISEPSTPWIDIKDHATLYPDRILNLDATFSVLQPESILEQDTRTIDSEFFYEDPPTPGARWLSVKGFHTATNPWCVRSEVIEGTTSIIEFSDVGYSYIDIPVSGGTGHIHIDQVVHIKIGAFSTIHMDGGDICVPYASSINLSHLLRTYTPSILTHDCVFISLCHSGDALRFTSGTLCATTYGLDNLSEEPNIELTPLQIDCMVNKINII